MTDLGALEARLAGMSQVGSHQVNQLELPDGRVLLAPAIATVIATVNWG